MAAAGETKNQTDVVMAQRQAKVGNEVVGSVTLALSTDSV